MVSAGLSHRVLSRLISRSHKYRSFNTSRSTQCSQSSTRRFPRTGNNSRVLPNKRLDTRGPSSVGEVVAGRPSVAAHNSINLSVRFRGLFTQTYRWWALGVSLWRIRLLSVTLLGRIVRLLLVALRRASVTALVSMLRVLTRRSLVVELVGGHGVCVCVCVMVEVRTADEAVRRAELN
ncbi:uncharacterized protein BDV14DRAFT_181579 [Aspergillus stella-maris]|uniref:uncharacterized protein n=1 Tax=Aspergillus stella-maris TaxID=1810926 RepID=UPI003CCDA895